MASKLRFMDYGLWITVYGLLIMVYCYILWLRVYGLRFMDVYGSRFMVAFYGYGLLLLNIKLEALEIFDSRRLIPRG